MTRAPIPLALTCLLFLANAETSSASWLPDGNLVTDLGGTKEAPLIVADGAGGAIIAWTHARNIHAQRLTSSGNHAPGWTSQGVAVCTAADEQFLTGAIPDGSGGAYLVWEDYRDFATTGEDVYLHHVLADGTLAPGWPPNGLAVAALPGAQRSAVLAPDGEGGVFVAWSDERYGQPNRDVYLLRFQPNGVPAAGWLGSGIPVSSAPGRQSFPSIAPDGSGGAIVSWTDTRNAASSVADIYGTRIDRNGATRPGWNADGSIVCAAGGAQTSSQVLAIADGGVFVAWSDYRTAPPADPFLDSSRDLYCNRLTSGGTVAPGWKADGLPICIAPQTQQGHRIASDGSGGIYVAWQDNRDSDYDVYLQRIRPDATLSPGWPIDGLKPLPSLVGFQLHPHLAPDGEGGLYLSIDLLASGYSVHAQHMTAVGTQAPGWPDFGLPATSVHTNEDESQITADGFGGAILVWKDFRNQRDDLYAKRLAPLGPTATLVSLQSATTEPGVAKLAWLVTGAASLRATIERRTEATEWAALATVIADGTGRIAYEDATVEPGGRYAYRLRYAVDDAETTTPEAWLDVPVRYELVLAGFRPNPATPGDLTVAFTLPARAAGSLELLDLAGRRVASRDLSSFGAGRHTLRLDEAGMAKAGVYWVRLLHGGRTFTARGIVVR